ncbi:hypothetical protein ACIA5D_06535 [Actinoplanes sp. NPDC051513]|uniref:hypothetical protein n=1 Tax=Actinoplanes sp. NPDC051513 TaxID=3363908 RepID=UPI00379BF51B
MSAQAAFQQDELIRTDEALADVRLIGPSPRGDAPMAVTLRCGRPLLYPLPPSDLPARLHDRSAATGARYVGAVLAFDLDEPPAGYRYAAARFTVDLGDSGAIGVLVHSAGDQFGLVAGDALSPLADRAAAAGRPGLLRRLGVRADRPAAWTTGVLSPRFGWRYRDRRDAPLLPRSYGVHAVLEVPPGVAELVGVLEAGADLAGPARRRFSSAERVAFTTPLPGAPAARSAAVRLCMAADVVSYSSRGPAAAERVQRDLVRILADGRATAGIRPNDVAPQPQGDGQFTVLPVGLDEAAAIPRLLRGIAAALTARNAAEPGDRMRLRLALHRGLVKEADNGWVGRATTAVHRILDSPPLRTALVEHPHADYVLGVPDVLFADVLSTTDDPPPASFRPITVDLPHKGFLEQAWLHVPGAAA